MPINCPLVPKVNLWLRTINTDLCVCLFFSALLSLLLWCFNTIAVAIHISGLIEVFVHLVCRKLVFFLFLFGCRRLTIWILLLFQLLLLLLLQLLALFGLVLFFFFLFHFKTQNSKKFRNPKDSVATQSLKVKTFLKVQFLHTLLANVVLFVLLSAKTSFRNCSG